MPHQTSTKTIRRITTLFPAVALLLTLFPAYAQQCDDCQISQARERQANQRLQLNSQQEQTAFMSSLELFLIRYSAVHPQARPG
jgi:hypothetical protein